jgi:hypothetical protein
MLWKEAGPDRLQIEGQDEVGEENDWPKVKTILMETLR